MAKILLESTLVEWGINIWIEKDTTGKRKIVQPLTTNSVNDVGHWAFFRLQREKVTQ